MSVTLKSLNESLLTEFNNIDSYKDNPKMLQSCLEKAKVKNELARTIQGNIKLELEATRLQLDKGLASCELPEPFEGKRNNNYKI